MHKCTHTHTHVQTQRGRNLYIKVSKDAIRKMSAKSSNKIKWLKEKYDILVP